MGVAVALIVGVVVGVVITFVALMLIDEKGDSDK